MIVLHLQGRNNVHVDGYLTGADTWHFITTRYLLSFSKPYDLKLIRCYILLISSLH